MNGDYRNGELFLHGSGISVVTGKQIRRVCPCMRARVWEGKHAGKKHVVVSFHDEDRGVHDLDVQFRAEYCAGLIDLLLTCVPKNRAERVLAMHGYVPSDERARLDEIAKGDAR